MLYSISAFVRWVRTIRKHIERRKMVPRRWSWCYYRNRKRRSDSRKRQLYGGPYGGPHTLRESSWNHNHTNKLHMYKPQPTVVQWQSTGGPSQESWVQSPATVSSSSHLLSPQNIKCIYIDSLTTLVSCSWEVYEPSLEAAIAAWNTRERWEWFGGERLKHFSSVPFHRWRCCESVSCHQTGCSDGEQRCPPWTSLTRLYQHNQSNRSKKFNRISHQELLH